MRGITPWIFAVVLLLAVTSCSSSGSPTASTRAPAPAPTVVEHVRADAIDEALRTELLGMQERDQAERLEGADTEGDQARTDRLAQIVDDSGWPGISLVGEDGEDAAWTIAQHSDLDPDFQSRALELLRSAVAADDASPGNLAYLDDRVAVAAGEPQAYGTQVGCGEDGPEPATPIADPASVDERRIAAGLAPLADYLAEMAQVCAGEQ